MQIDLNRIKLDPLATDDVIVSIPRKVSEGHQEEISADLSQNTVSKNFRKDRRIKTVLTESLLFRAVLLNDKTAYIANAKNTMNR